MNREQWEIVLAALEAFDPALPQVQEIIVIVREILEGKRYG